MTTSARTRPGTGWTWHNAGRIVTGTTWGGNLEILHWTLAISRWLHPVETYAGCIAIFETSEETPSGEEVYRILRNFGERGLLARFPAVRWGRPKAATRLEHGTPESRQAFGDEQRAAVLRAFATYNPDAMIVFDVDLGHTDPQYVLPCGGRMSVDGPARRIVTHY